MKVEDIVQVRLEGDSYEIDLICPTCNKLCRTFRRVWVVGGGWVFAGGVLCTCRESISINMKMNSQGILSVTVQHPYILQSESTRVYWSFRENMIKGFKE